VLTLLADDDCATEKALDLFGASRVCERGGQTKRARKLCEQSITSGLPAQVDRRARKALARLAKRGGDLESACEIWRSAVGNSREGYEAYEQLASHFEHKARQPEKALEVVREALAELGRAEREGTILSGAFLRTQARFERRRQRLEHMTQKVLTSVS
jgi:Tfp pilus assembly protein PilF